MQDMTKDDYFSKREDFIQYSKEWNEKSQIKKVVKNTLIEKVEPIINNIQNVINSNSTPMLSTQTIGRPIIEGKDEMSDIYRALADASLPSKQPLQSTDPFIYLTSKNFVVSFACISLMIMNLMNIVG